MLKTYRSLGPYLKKHRLFYILGILALLVTAGGQIIIPQFIRRAVDLVATGNFTMAGVLGIVLGMIGTALGISIFRYAWRFFIQSASRSIEAELRKDYFDQLLRLSSSFFGSYKTGDLMARATNDMRAVRMATSMALVAAVDGIFMTTAILILLFVEYPRLTLFTIIPLPVITFLLLGFGSLIGERFKRVQEGFSHLSDQAQEVFSGIRIVKSFVKERYFLRKFASSNEEYQVRNLKLVRLWGLFFPLVSFLAGMTTLILLRVGGGMVITGEISTGDFVAVLAYLNMLIWPMMGAGFTVNLLQRGAASLNRINEVVHAQPDIESPDGGISEEARGEITVENLNYSYPGSDVPVLEGVSFHLPLGSILGILGRTGSGKSTLLNLLPRILDPPPGTVFLDGRDVREYDLAALRRSFGFVPQDSFLFSMSLRDNIAYGLDGRNDEVVDRVAEVSTINRDAKDFYAGFETMVGERGITLSGGQKQRTAISRALAVEANILVFDDALSAVDTETEEKILSELLEYRKGKSSIIVSHRVSTLSSADRIIVLDGGRIVQEGTHEELMCEEGFYREVYTLQSLDADEGLSECAGNDSGGEDETGGGE
jgi:ATP-binding cassette subfamily B protein